MNVRPAPARPATAPDPHEGLRRASHALEAVFINQLFQAMRASVPQEEATDSAARDLFTGMLDERFATLTAEGSTRGLGEALYHQMARRLDAVTGPDAGTKGK